MLASLLYARHTRHRMRIRVAIMLYPVQNCAARHLPNTNTVVARITSMFLRPFPWELNIDLNEWESHTYRFGYLQEYTYDTLCQRSENNRLGWINQKLDAICTPLWRKVRAQGNTVRWNKGHLYDAVEQQGWECFDIYLKDRSKEKQRMLQTKNWSYLLLQYTRFVHSKCTADTERKTTGFAFVELNKAVHLNWFNTNADSLQMDNGAWRCKIAPVMAINAWTRASLIRCELTVHAVCKLVCAVALDPDTKTSLARCGHKAHVVAK